MGVTTGFALHGVTRAEGDRQILRGVDLTIGAGTTALLGPSGSGKSSVLRLLNRLDVPTAGTVTLDGTDLADLDPLALRRRVGMVFQRPLLFPGTVFENLAVARPDLDRSGAGAELAAVGLDPTMLDQDAATLSGGEGQRLALARTLGNRPDVLLADEVTSALDTESSAAILELLAGLADDGTTVIAVTHRPEDARRLADRIVVVIDGRVQAAGTADELATSTDPVVRQALGVEP